MDNIEELFVKDDVDFTQKYTSGLEFTDANEGKLDLSELDIIVDIPDIDQYSNEEYALLRKNGIGTSDSSTVLGVNPYTTRSELIAEKCRDFLTEEELQIGEKSAVKKGRDLEPMIIYKHSKIIGRKVIKPTDMYRHKEYPFIKFNFDGVIDKVFNKDGTYQYIPDEIKVVTYFGRKHYDFNKATYSELTGWKTIPPKTLSEENTTIEIKAANYGIPPYYYTQLQQQIFGLNAPYGFLTVIYDPSWEIHSFLIWRDQRVINQLLIEHTKTWNIIEKKRPNNFNISIKKEEI